MSLTDKHSVHKAPKLDAGAIATLLPEVAGYAVDEPSSAISREYTFSNYYETIAFVNAVAYIANREDHHPDLRVSYSKCRVRFSTHDAGGLSENDFICAAKVNALLG